MKFSAVTSFLREEENDDEHQKEKKEQPSSSSTQHRRVLLETPLDRVVFIQRVLNFAMKNAEDPLRFSLVSNSWRETTCSERYSTSVTFWSRNFFPAARNPLAPPPRNIPGQKLDNNNNILNFDLVEDRFKVQECWAASYVEIANIMCVAVRHGIYWIVKSLHKAGFEKNAPCLATPKKRRIDSKNTNDNDDDQKNTFDNDNDDDDILVVRDETHSSTPSAYKSPPLTCDVTDPLRLAVASGRPDIVELLLFSPECGFYDPHESYFSDAGNIQKQIDAHNSEFTLNLIRGFARGAVRSKFPELHRTFFKSSLIEQATVKAVESVSSLKLKFTVGFNNMDDKTTDDVQNNHHDREEIEEKTFHHTSSVLDWENYEILRQLPAAVQIVVLLILRVKFSNRIDEQKKERESTAVRDKNVYFLQREADYNYAISSRLLYQSSTPISQTSHFLKSLLSMNYHISPSPEIDDRLDILLNNPNNNNKKLTKTTPLHICVANDDFLPLTKYLLLNGAKIGEGQFCEGKESENQNSPRTSSKIQRARARLQIHTINELRQGPFSWIQPLIPHQLTPLMIASTTVLHHQNSSSTNSNTISTFHFLLRFLKYRFLLNWKSLPKIIEQCCGNNNNNNNSSADDDSEEEPDFLQFLYRTAVVNKILTENQGSSPLALIHKIIEDENVIALRMLVEFVLVEMREPLLRLSAKNTYMDSHEKERKKNIAYIVSEILEQPQGADHELKKLPIHFTVDRQNFTNEAKSLEMLKILVERGGVDVNAVIAFTNNSNNDHELTRKGDTALTLSVLREETRLCLYLLDHGAKNIPCNENLHQTPWSIAQKLKLEEVVAKMQEIDPSGF